MTRERMEPLSADIERLLANERLDFPQPEDFRRRALLRARAVTRTAPSFHRARPRFAGLRWMAAAPVLLVAATLSAAVIQARRTAARSALERPLAAAPAAATPPAVAHAPSQQRAPETDIRVEAPPAAKAVQGPRHVRTVAEDYALERKILQPARAALAGGDSSSALTAIAEHERRFPAGQLAEEREALRVEALLSAHRTDEARSAAAAFRNRFPRSVLLSRVSEALQAAP